MTADSERRNAARTAFNRQFLNRLYRRRPHLQLSHEAVYAASEESAPSNNFLQDSQRLAPGAQGFRISDAAAETIVSRERPVLFLKNDWIDTGNAMIEGDEARDLVTDLDQRKPTFQPLMPLIGRIDVVGLPGYAYVGTAWCIDVDIVITNRHVAKIIAEQNGRQFVFARGAGNQPIDVTFNSLHEFDDLSEQARDFNVLEVLYIAPDAGPDIAFLKIARQTDGSRPDCIQIADSDASSDTPVFIVGYPARAPRSVIPDQQLMKDLYRGHYNVKRAAPGYTMANSGGSTTHDCTTLGGNSGSVLFDLSSGKAVGLHFAGLYQETNFAVPASVLRDFISQKRWNKPFEIETRHGGRALAQASPPAPSKANAGPDTGGSVSITLPLTITVSLGGAGSASQTIAFQATRSLANFDVASVEAACKAYWQSKPGLVIAARVGFEADGETFGDTAFIAASVLPSQLSEAEQRGPRSFQGVPIQYFPATVAEQIDHIPELESVDSIAYDDDARTGDDFSFETVNEVMTARLHVGPEYSWDELKAFLGAATESLVSAMYEFRGPHIRDELEARLDDGVALKMVLDTKTFAKVQDTEIEFDSLPAFADWKTRFGRKFDRVVAPMGHAGLISDSYHIKVTVREDQTFWLSSGNWKIDSSQPLITQKQRDNATEEDLPGNREWHVVISNPTLSKRFRAHILQDFKRSHDLGAGDVPRSKKDLETYVDVPIEEETILEERRPPSRIIEPKTINRKIKVKPILTPDSEGAIYSETVIDLIRSAKDSLLFQIPYIAMPPTPDTDRGYIDRLIEALVEKMLTLRDARVVLRVGSSKFSTPTHAAWHFKSKGVDINKQLKQIENHHTKGMIVDGERVLLGSHNWSSSGVTLNRDASLLFYDKEIAGYYAEAFEIDWERATPIKPRKYVDHRKDEGVVREAVGDVAPAGYRRMLLCDLLKDED